MPQVAGNKLGFGLLLVCCSGLSAFAESPPRVAIFSVDATPPLGTPISYGPATDVMDPLSCRGVILLSSDLPVVLCAVDWLSLRNGAYDAFRLGLAEAVGTAPDRVAVHVLHQHDAPSYDFDAELLLDAHGRGFPADYCRDTIRRAAAAAREALDAALDVTHIGMGKGRVEQVASNRRILGSDGRVLYSRWSSMKRPEVRAAPEGIIDPDVRLISFWNQETPLAAITWYATHPQSYYTRGRLSSDFVGLARKKREQATGVFHLHFNGAGGNITAGKYNDGSASNRPVLANRLADGMSAAWEATRRSPISSQDIRWTVHRASLPPAKNLDEDELIAELKANNSGGASKLAWIRRCNHGYQIPLTSLQLGSAYLLHMPGELFVEYQLAAQAMRPDAFVCLAAYGDGGPGYIGTAAAYPQGGYEVGSPSNVAPEVETELTQAMRILLRSKTEISAWPSDWTARSPRVGAAAP